MGFDVKTQIREWTHVPFEAEGIGYFSSEEALLWPEEYLDAIVKEAENTRYGLSDWRNHNNLWRSTLGLDTTFDKTILDYGCGNGLEALQFARNGNRVVLADIINSNMDLAERVLNLYGFKSAGKVLLTVEPPFITTDIKVDIFYANGVLHHTPYFREVLLKAKDMLAENGEIRLMLYSDKSWTIYCNPELPDFRSDVRTSPHFQTYIRAMDYVGFYADWFTPEKIELKVGDFLRIEKLDYITNDGRYLTCTLKPK